MNDITVIVLTKNEEKNIRQCIESAKRIAKRIVVVDSESTDDTTKIAQSLGAQVYTNPWPGHAAQFNWALDNCEIQTKWVFRLDADERIPEPLAQEIVRRLASPEAEEMAAYELRWYTYFMNKCLRYGGSHKTYILRLFKYGLGRVEEKLMDERFAVEGPVAKLQESLIHYDYKGLDAWLTKHVWYSQLELQMYRTQMEETGANEAQHKRRGFYYRLPKFFRARLYYWYRYYAQLGFLDGREGKIFCYLQAYWFRFLVDTKIYELEKALLEEQK